MNTQCKERGCSKTKIAAKGLCMTHYKKQNTPTGKKYPPRGLSTGERIEWTGWDVNETGCWISRYYKNPQGYAVMNPTDGRAGRALLVHRAYYEYINGPIPPGEGYHGTVVRHTCDVRSCINPNHLILGTQEENLKDMHTRGRTGDRKRKVTPKIAREIRALLAEGELTQKQIAEKFEISPSHVSNIKMGRTHKPI